MKPPFIYSWESGGATLSGGMMMLGSGGEWRNLRNRCQQCRGAKAAVDTAAAKGVSSAAGAVEKELQTKTKPLIISVVIGDDVVIAQGVREDSSRLPP